MIIVILLIHENRKTIEYVKGHRCLKNMFTRNIKRKWKNKKTDIYS